MQQKYLVGESDTEFGDGEFRIVVASSAEEAASKFAKHVVIRDELFLEDIYDKAINASFAEHFWIQTEEEHELLERAGKTKLKKEEFAGRVRAYFADRSDFADIYLAFYFGDDTPNFPEDMLLYMWRNSNWSDLAVVDLADIETI